MLVRHGNFDKTGLIQDSLYRGLASPDSLLGKPAENFGSGEVELLAQSDDVSVPELVFQTGDTHSGILRINSVHGLFVDTVFRRVYAVQPKECP